MFGTEAAANINNPNYVWDSGAKPVFVYFKTESGIGAMGTGSNFGTGTLVLIGGAGLAAGVLLTVLIFFIIAKKKKNVPQTA